jgi:Ser/Thr protein kinase RdoA (MazF antagonist)
MAHQPYPLNQMGNVTSPDGDLEEFLRAHWGVRPADAAPDLGGSANLNLLVTDGRSLRVARVYRPFVTSERVAALQAVRRHLARHGIPCVEPIPAPRRPRIGDLPGPGAGSSLHRPRTPAFQMRRTSNDSPRLTFLASRLTPPGH